MRNFSFKKALKSTGLFLLFIIGFGLFFAGLVLLSGWLAVFFVVDQVLIMAGLILLITMISVGIIGGIY